MSRDEKRHWVALAARVLDCVLPDEKQNNWQTYDLLLPHAMPCFGWLCELEVLPPHGVLLIQQLFTYFCKRNMYSEAQQLGVRASFLFEKAFGEQDPRLAEVLVNVAGVFLVNKKPDEAEGMLLRAQQIIEPTLGKQHVLYALCLHNRGGVACLKGRLTEAGTLFQEANERLESAIGANDLMMAETLVDYSKYCTMVGSHAEARRLMDRANIIRSSLNIP